VGSLGSWRFFVGEVGELTDNLFKCGEHSLVEFDGLWQQFIDIYISEKVRCGGSYMQLIGVEIDI